MKKAIIVGITLLAMYGFYSFKKQSKPVLENLNGIHFYKGT
jgi:hypothetical protein